ncbi:sn-glycerol-3-phosphate ABC transporter ATP-binding protein UgpC [Mesorhizobium tamadayense]|uniref:sn-glycerol-3-phosphate ABC transporter ATP-binding protein UgpC n=1 Tax=Mesorhizobium tamadayense TaxID=425306 RepID=A0A3P3FRG4_9HYPH|nr:sn-glycerol-3-phosphate ABC transporter ATP-binding protein UgpC [Mesorhizobium tamadayense]RRI00703.1 sn-glycerol-3-phosphate ABC transporter ATP-binding protein UgpC [Mesorhizobium tamadayense]
MGRITLTNIDRAYGKMKILHDINLDVGDGEMLVLVGPSGCGKSTLLRLIAGLDRPTGGRIEIDGADVTDVSAAQRGLAMVFQSYALYPHMSVRQNLAFGLENVRMPKTEIDARIAEAARMLEIAPYLDRRPGQLSGGQKQRVAIGRAVVRNPTAFLLDEPLSNLDAELRISTRAELAALHKRLATTMIYVTHDQVEAMTLADRIVVMRSGRIEQVGRPLDLYNAPANLFVAGFIGAPRMNLLPVKVRSANGSQVHVEGPGGLSAVVSADGTALKPEDDATLGIRPHDIELSDGGKGAVSAKVTLAEALGPETVIHATIAGDNKLVAVLKRQDVEAQDAPISLTLPWERMHLFDAAGLRVASR